MLSPYVDSSMDVAEFLSWQDANSDHVHRTYENRIESHAKHMFLDLRLRLLLSIKISS